MSNLTFNRRTGTLTATHSNGASAGAWRAANNVDSHSAGHWPPGRFGFAWYDRSVADGPNGSYGAYGILTFGVKGRTGMGIHSGEATRPDGMGRTGIYHCTMGCIRTTNDAMNALVSLHATDPIQTLTVID
jgi:hypothetical protein